MKPEDLSVAYEAVGRPELGLDKLIRKIQVSTCGNYNDGPHWEPFNVLWSKVNHLSLLGLKAYPIYKLALQAMSLEGNFIECGVFQGGLSFMLAMMLKNLKSDKVVHICDTFAGLPAPDRRFDEAYSEGSMVGNRLELQENIRTLEIQKQCVIHQGLFSKTLKNIYGGNRFSFAHLDCDLYQGTKDAIEHIYPRLSKSAPVVIDDYYDESHGVMQAINEYAEKEEIVIHLGVHGQAYFIKGEEPSAFKKLKIGYHSVYMTMDAILEDPTYLDLLGKIADFQEQRTSMLRDFIALCQGDRKQVGAI